MGTTVFLEDSTNIVIKPMSLGFFKSASIYVRQSRILQKLCNGSDITGTTTFLDGPINITSSLYMCIYIAQTLQKHY